MPGKAYRGSNVTFGEFGLMTTQPGWITSRQIEAARIAMTRHVKRGGKIWIRIFPDKPITKKPAETRMGTGKGGVEYYVAVVKPGRILYEMGGMDEQVAHDALKLAQAKLPVITRIVHRADLSLSEELRHGHRQGAARADPRGPEPARGRAARVAVQGPAEAADRRAGVSPAKRNDARRDLARILTVITQKKQAAAAKA